MVCCIHQRRPCRHLGLRAATCAAVILATLWTELQQQQQQQQQLQHSSSSSSAFYCGAAFPFLAAHGAAHDGLETESPDSAHDDAESPLEGEETLFHEPEVHPADSQLHAPSSLDAEEETPAAAAAEAEEEREGVSSGDTTTTPQVYEAAPSSAAAPVSPNGTLSGGAADTALSPTRPREDLQHLQQETPRLQLRDSNRTDLESPDGLSGRLFQRPATQSSAVSSAAAQQLLSPHTAEAPLLHAQQLQPLSPAAAAAAPPPSGVSDAQQTQESLDSSQASTEPLSPWDQRSPLQEAPPLHTQPQDLQHELSHGPPAQDLQQQQQQQQQHEQQQQQHADNAVLASVESGDSVPADPRLGRCSAQELQGLTLHFADGTACPAYSCIDTESSTYQSLIEQQYGSQFSTEEAEALAGILAACHCRCPIMKCEVEYIGKKGSDTCKAATKDFCLQSNSKFSEKCAFVAKQVPKVYDIDADPHAFKRPCLVCDPEEFGGSLTEIDGRTPENGSPAAWQGSLGTAAAAAICSLALW